jgi:hypothetical protein
MKASRKQNRGVAAILITTGIVLTLLVAIASLYTLNIFQTNNIQREIQSNTGSQMNPVAAEYLNAMTGNGEILPFQTLPSGTQGAGIQWINFAQTATNTSLATPPPLYSYAFTQGFCAQTAGSTIANCCPGGNCGVQFAVSLCDTAGGMPVSFEPIFTGGLQPSAISCPTTVTSVASISSYDMGPTSPTANNLVINSRTTVPNGVGRTPAQLNTQVATSSAMINNRFYGMPAPMPECSFTPPASVVQSGNSQTVGLNLFVQNPPLFNIPNQPYAAPGQPNQTIPGPITSGNTLNGWMSQATYFGQTVQNPSPQANPYFTTAVTPNDTTPLYTWTATVAGIGGTNSCSTNVYTVPTCTIAESAPSAQIGSSSGNACTNVTLTVTAPPHPNADNVVQGKITGNGNSTVVTIPATSGTATAPTPICFTTAGTYTITGAVNNPINASDFSTYSCGSVPFTATPPAPPTCTLTGTTPLFPSQTGTLTWTSTNAVSCTDPVTGTPAGITGSDTIGPLTSTTSYSMTCSDASGVATGCSTTIAVNPSSVSPALTINFREELQWAAICNPPPNDGHNECKPAASPQGALDGRSTTSPYICNCANGGAAEFDLEADSGLYYTTSNWPSNNANRIFSAANQTLNYRALYRNSNETYGTAFFIAINTYDAQGNVTMAYLNSWTLYTPPHHPSTSGWNTTTVTEGQEIVTSISPALSAESPCPPPYNANPRDYIGIFAGCPQIENLTDCNMFVWPIQCQMTTTCSGSIYDNGSGGCVAGAKCDATHPCLYAPDGEPAAWITQYGIYSNAYVQPYSLPWTY